MVKKHSIATASALLALQTATCACARETANSCRLLLMGRRGWDLVAVRGRRVKTIAKIGPLGSYGFNSKYLATAVTGHANLWNIRDGTPAGAFILPNNLRVPILMEGFSHGMVVQRRALYFTTVAGPLTGHDGLEMIHLATRTGAVVGRATIPRPEHMLANAEAIRGVVMFSYAYRSSHPSGLVLASVPGMRLSHMGNVVPANGGVCYVPHFGLVAWSGAGRIQRLTGANMSRGRFRPIRALRGIMQVHAVHHAGAAGLACLTFTGYNPSKINSTPVAATLFIYDLRRRRILWRKKFRFPMSVMSESFASSSGGDVFTFINMREHSVMFYDHKTGRVTTVTLPPKYPSYYLHWARVIPVRRRAVVQK